MLGMWKSWVQALFLGVTFLVWINSAFGIKIDVIPSNPKVGDTVTFKVTEVSGSIRFATWYQGQSTSAPDQILNFFPPDSEIHGDKYFAQAQGQANGSLVISKIIKAFEGYYTVQIQTTESLQQSSVQLTVNGVISLALSPLALLLGVLLLSDFNFL
ncbi:pregnancy-specific glycoprotein 22-like [Pyxicephalus adspersus]|uniref:pregnancy-specific glycoprotein 22-like n=1 Tax=Pyxicephalus adspersus TaxID=30357 RepID=UPI003B5B7E22